MPTVSLAPTDDVVQLVLWTFLTAVLPPGTEVIRGQQNRLPEPSAANYVTMTPISRPRLSTTVDATVDAVFTGSMAAALMTITAVDPRFQAPLAVGSEMLGVGVEPNTLIAALGTGTGGVGTYVVSPSQTLSSRTLAAGRFEATQPTQMTIQLDVHGPLGGQNAQVISTMMRDEFAVDNFARQSGAVVPLYAGDPRQMPFVNAEKQYEDRWVVDAVLQVNQTVTVTGQEFADMVALAIVSVDAAYPPT